MLREFGCPQVQGFLYGYPGTPEAVSRPPLKLKQSRQEAAPPEALPSLRRNRRQRCVVVRGVDVTLAGAEGAAKTPPKNPLDPAP
jgi:hypothetical protein